MNASPLSETADAPHEEELKIALGSKPEFALWRTALGQPERTLHQLNFYFRPAHLDEPARLINNHLLLRIRTVLPHAVPEQEHTDAWGRRIISAPDLEAACAAWAKAMPETSTVIFTLKKGLTQENGYFRSIELETPLNNKQAVQVLRGDLTVLGASAPGNYLREQQIEQCHFIGTLLNTRCCYRRPDGEVWELDLSRFPNRYDCELEAETSQPKRVLEDIRTLAAELGTPIKAQTKTKLQRFLEASGLL